MNRTPLARRIQVINCLVEGNSIRSTERLTNTHRDTVMRLMVQGDEIWTYVQKKQRWVTPQDDRARVGDMWTFVGLISRYQVDPCLQGREALSRACRGVHGRSFGTAQQSCPALK